MKLPLVDPKMNSFLLTALPEAVLRRDQRLLPWLYENFINIYSLPNGILMYTGLSLRSTLAREKSLFHYAIPQNTKEPTEFSVADFCRKQITEAGNYIYVFLDESKLSVMPSYGRGSHIHDSLLYGYDADRNGFFAIAQVDYHKKEVFYPADELEEAYHSAYSGSSEKAQLVAFRIPDKLCGAYPFSLDRFLSRLADYINREQTVAEHYFAPENSKGISFGHAANFVFAHKIPLDRSLSFIEFRTMNFIAEHRRGLLERFEYLTEQYCFPVEWTTVLNSYRSLAAEYDRMRLLALKLYLSPPFRRESNARFQKDLLCTLEKESGLLRKILTLAQHGEPQDLRFLHDRSIPYKITTEDFPPEEDCPGFSHAAIFRCSFPAEEVLGSIRLSRRGAMALYDEHGLILRHFSPLEAVGRSITLSFPARRTRRLDIRVWSDAEITEDTMKIRFGNPDLALGKSATATSCWPDSDGMSFGAEQALSDDPETFWNAAKDWKPGEMLTVNLGREHDVTRIRLTERPRQSRILRYSLFVAGEDQNWNPIVEERIGLWQSIPQTWTVGCTPVRFVRVIIHETATNENGFNEPGIARVEAY